LRMVSQTGGHLQSGFWERQGCVTRRWSLKAHSSFVDVKVGGVWWFEDIPRREALHRKAAPRPFCGLSGHFGRGARLPRRTLPRELSRRVGRRMRGCIPYGLVLYGMPCLRDLVSQGPLRDFCSQGLSRRDVSGTVSGVLVTGFLSQGHGDVVTGTLSQGSCNGTLP
jgi:hypothetical protein